MSLLILLNIVTFFDTILIILLIYYGLKFFARYFGPKVVEKAAEKIIRDMQEKERARTKPNAPGQVTVEKTEKKEKSFQRREGEYVDFEEIK